MTTKLIICLFLLAMAVHTESKFAPTSKDNPPAAEERRIYNDEKMRVQYEERKAGEELGDERRDLEFDAEIGSESGRPSKLPTVNEVQRLFNSQKDRMTSEARMLGEGFSSSLSSSSSSSLSSKQGRSKQVSSKVDAQFCSLKTWQKDTHQCCPRSWNYQCRSTTVRQPCFIYKYRGTREWCCPIWPIIWVRKCQCSQCAVLTATCAQEGRCRRRYSRRSFLAVCDRGHQWDLIRYIRKPLPSSCYCNVNKEATS